MTDKKIIQLLLDLKCPTNILGFEYLKQAVHIVTENKGIRKMELYRSIAETCNKKPPVTTTNVERSMRYALEHVVANNTPLYQKLFGDAKKVVNSEFISRCILYLEAGV